MVRYKKSLYAYEALSESAEAFGHLCKISIDDANEYWQVEFENCVEDEHLTVKEFSNYIIEIINGADMV